MYSFVGKKKSAKIPAPLYAFSILKSSCEALNFEEIIPCTSLEDGYRRNAVSTEAHTKEGRPLIVPYSSLFSHSPRNPALIGQLAPNVAMESSFVRFQEIRRSRAKPRQNLPTAIEFNNVKAWKRTEFGIRNKP